MTRVPRGALLPALVAAVVACASAGITEGHLRADGTRLVNPDGTAFAWRGITAFRLLDFVADGQEPRAIEYLTFAASHDLTVVRVMAMMNRLFELTPAEGRAALPRLLELAAERKIHVEIVGLAGTAAVPVDLDEQISALGRIAAAHPNALLELANEPVHPSQSKDVQNPEVLRRLGGLVPPAVPVALGSVERGDGFAGRDYLTWHVPRESRPDGWGHVLEIAKGAELLEKWKRPLVSDEPIGAGPRLEPGRRDDSPARFRAAALLTRLTGLGATFHYDGGIQTTIPAGTELACLDAWLEAWTLLPPDVEQHGTFRASGTADAVVRQFNRDVTYAVFERTDGRQGWVLAMGKGDPALELAPGWSAAETKAFEGIRLISVKRR